MQCVSILLLAGSIACLFSLSSAVPSAASDNNLPSGNSGQTAQDYPSGDPRRCLEVSKKNGFKMARFEVLPGFGWDNLRNVHEGQVVTFNYSQCRTTDDGRFLLPDSVSAVPVKASRAEAFAELTSHWKDWTSSSSKSINVDAGLSLEEVSISGKFSDEFGDVKSKQIGDSSLTTRAQLRYVRYKVHLQPDTPLHPVFKNRVLAIAAAEQLKQKQQARYLSQLLVRDFGTHVVTKADAGASLEQVDQVNEEWVQSQSEHKSDILASASASLYGVFKMTASYETTSSQDTAEGYKTHRSSSSVLTKGGQLFKPSNFTPDMWASSVDNDLVVLDRAGDPLHYFITEATLPELPASTLNEVHNEVTKAIEHYYSFNHIPGCLDTDSPNFSPAANADDGSCQPPPTNLTFGGVFQTCAMQDGSNNGDLCGGMTQVNPLTGTYSCPDSYQTVLLHSGSVSSSHSEHVCKSHWIFGKECHDDFYQSQATYDINWCVATGPVPKDSGYMFGGLFTPKINNPLTRAMSCPPQFFPLKIGSQADLQVCISDDHDFGMNYAVPFGGFVSCSAGNPLTVGGSSGSGQGQTAGKLKSFFKGTASGWPKRCPDGFSRHLATVDQGCQISYCVQTNSLSAPVLPLVKRPPFVSAPPLVAPPSDNVVIFDPDTKTWKRNREAVQMMTMSASADTVQFSSVQASMRSGLPIRAPPHPSAKSSYKSPSKAAATLFESPGDESSDDASSSMSPGTAAGISIGATLGCVVLATLAVVAVRARRRRNGSGYRRLQNPLLDPQGDYGSVTSADRPASSVTVAAVVENEQ